MNAVRWLELATQDVRYGLRAMRRSPTSAAVALVTLAVGIGVDAMVFTVTNAVLFKGFAGVYRNDRLLYISNGGCCVAYADFEDYRTQAKSFDGMAIVHGVSFVYSDASGFAQNVDANENSANVFRVVGQKPMVRHRTPGRRRQGRDRAVGDSNHREAAGHPVLSHEQGLAADGRSVS
jgi:hypothetical protein